MGIQSLMSAAQAAGYAMAPSEDLMDDEDLAEEILAAREEGGLESGKDLASAARPQEPVLGNWWRDLLFGWFGGRATA